MHHRRRAASVTTQVHAGPTLNSAQRHVKTRPSRHIPSPPASVCLGLVQSHASRMNGADVGTITGMPLVGLVPTRDIGIIGTIDRYRAELHQQLPESSFTGIELRGVG